VHHAEAQSEIADYPKIENGHLSASSTVYVLLYLLLSLLRYNRRLF